MAQDFGGSFGGHNPYAAGYTGPARAPAPYDVPPVGGGYEFTEPQNLVIRGLAKAMKFVGVLFVILGGLQGISGLATIAGKSAAGAGSVIGGILYIVMGSYTVSAAGYFARVVSTQGDDIGNMMSALKRLSGLFGLMRVLFIIAIAVVCVAFIGGFIFGLAHLGH